MLTCPKVFAFGFYLPMGAALVYPLSILFTPLDILFLTGSNISNTVLTERSQNA